MIATYVTPRTLGRPIEHLTLGKAYRVRKMSSNGKWIFIENDVGVNYPYSTKWFRIRNAKSTVPAKLYPKWFDL